jgi:hypothetical protein
MTTIEKSNFPADLAQHHAYARVFHPKRTAPSLEGHEALV